MKKIITMLFLSLIMTVGIFAEPITDNGNHSVTFRISELAEKGFYDEICIQNGSSYLLKNIQLRITIDGKDHKLLPIDQVKSGRDDNFDGLEDDEMHDELKYFFGEKGKLTKKNPNKIYRASPRENGKYYAIESSYDDGKTWHSTGDSSPTQEEANKKIENMKNGLTASGLTQEEANKKIEAQKKREAAREAGTADGAWASQKGPSDEIVEKYTGKENPTKEEVKDAANEIIEKAVTDKQQGIQSKGNPYENKIANQDNIDDTRAIGATKEAKANIPEDTSTNDNVDQNSETESTKETSKNSETESTKKGIKTT